MIRRNNMKIWLETLNVTINEQNINYTVGQSNISEISLDEDKGIIEILYSDNDRKHELIYLQNVEQVDYTEINYM
jgi:hypothetical protein